MRIWGERNSTAASTGVGKQPVEADGRGPLTRETHVVRGPAKLKLRLPQRWQLAQ